jgi:hypothetical protein
MGEPYRYARQKLWQAVDCLVGDGPLRLRLGYAYTTLLILNADNDLPAELRDRFTALMQALDARADNEAHGPVTINTRAPKAGRLAGEVLSLYIALRGGI